MRDIKFRAWNDIDKTMIEWSTIKAFSALLSSLMGGGLKHHKLMQFTGLSDKNGKEIYDQDLLKHPYFKHPIVVFWDEDYACFDSAGVVSEWSECEVIGNIYENPELLEGGE